MQHNRFWSAVAIVFLAIVGTAAMATPSSAAPGNGAEHIHVPPGVRNVRPLRIHPVGAHGGKFEDRGGADIHRYTYFCWSQANHN